MSRLWGVLLMALVFSETVYSQEVREVGKSSANQKTESSLDSMKENPRLGEITVLPETTAPVEMSSSDINRVTCPGSIKDVIVSEEKGLIVRSEAKDVFIKFPLSRKGNETVYATAPADMIIICNGEIYNLILIPKRIPPRKVHLVSGPSEKIKTNLSLLGALPFEKKIVDLIKSVYTERIPFSFSKKTMNQKIDLFNELNMTLVQIVWAQGEGLRVKEYRAELADPNTERLELNRSQFLRKEMSSRPVGITVKPETLKKGDMARILIVEQTGGGVER
ncbi:MAG: type-F conjugative transfer system secretin TraK [Candidatus Manganitrophaceae bacterium]